MGIEQGVGRWNRGSGRAGWSSTSLPLGNSIGILSSLMYLSNVSCMILTACLWTHIHPQDYPCSETLLGIRVTTS